MNKRFGTLLRTDDRALGTLTHASTPVLIANLPPAAVPAQYQAPHLPAILDQGDCGACYMFAAVFALMARFRVFTDGAVQPDLDALQATFCQQTELSTLTRQAAAVSPSLRQRLELDTSASVCQRGTLYQAGRHLYRVGAVETGDDYCPGEPIGPDAARLWPAADLYHVSTTTSLLTLAKLLQEEICARGPVPAGFVMFPDFLDFTGSGVYQPAEGQRALGGHAVVLVGWGPGYWVCANSWGPSWGQGGYFRMQMANPLLLTEANHLCLLPMVPGVRLPVPLHTPVQAVRAADSRAKAALGVNPFTLYSLATTQAIFSGATRGQLLPPVFHQLFYAAPACITNPPLGPTIGLAIALVVAVALLVYTTHINLQRKNIYKT